MTLMAKHKISILEFTVRLQGAYPGCCHWPAVHSLLPPNRPPGTRRDLVCACPREEVHRGPGNRLQRIWVGNSIMPNDDSRFLKGTIPLGLTGEEGIQPEASQKRVFLNGWGQGKSLGLGLWLWMRLWVTKIKRKKHWSEILWWQRSCLNFLCISQYDRMWYILSVK